MDIRRGRQNLPHPNQRRAADIRMISGLSSSSHFPVLFGEFFLISPHISLIARSLATRVGANAVAQSIYGGSGVRAICRPEDWGRAPRWVPDVGSALLGAGFSRGNRERPPGAAAAVPGSYPPARTSCALGGQCAVHAPTRADDAFYNQCYNPGGCGAHQSTSSRSFIARSGEHAHLRVTARAPA